MSAQALLAGSGGDSSTILPGKDSRLGSLDPGPATLQPGHGRERQLRRRRLGLAAGEAQTRPSALGARESASHHSRKHLGNPYSFVWPQPRGSE